MIEKTIHYCWFGGKQKPKSVLKCIDSWRKYFPDFSIIEWNEENFDINVSPFCRTAYDMQRWAFVADYARLYIVYNNGGLYFDTDVEVIRPYNDILDQAFFLGFEDAGRVNTGLGFGAEKRSPIVKAMLDEYEGVDFGKSINSGESIVCPIFNTNGLKKLGIVLDGNENIHFQGGTIYREEYFCPINLYTRKITITDKTHSIHHFDNSWMTSRQKIGKWLYSKIGKTRLFGMLLKIARKI